jgi:hypothetical protein
MFIVKTRLMDEAGDDGSEPGGGAGDTGDTGGSWLDGLSDDMKGVVANKGWQNPGDVVKGYKNLEQLARGNPESLVRIPATDADPKDWENYYNKLGRPEDPANYELPETADWARETFHKLGLTDSQAKGLISALQEKATGAEEEATHAYNVKQTADIDALKDDWGAAYEQNVRLAMRAARTIGLTEEDIDAIEDAKGYGATIRIMHKIGAKLSEDSFEGGDPLGNPNVMTPAQAQDKISSLKMDRDFQKKLIGGDPLATQEWDNLHKMAWSKAS